MTVAAIDSRFPVLGSDPVERLTPVWESLWPGEQARIVTLLTQGIDYAGREKRIAIRLRTDGIGRLAANGTT